MMGSGGEGKKCTETSEAADEGAVGVEERAVIGKEGTGACLCGCVCVCRSESCICAPQRGKTGEGVVEGRRGRWDGERPWASVACACEVP